MALEDIAPGVFGQFPDMSGSLSPEQIQALQSNAAKQALLASAVTMLGMSGNQRVPVSTGQALGAALGAGSGAYQGSFDNTLKQMIANQQMQEYKSKADARRKYEQAIAGATTRQPIAMPMAQGQGSQLEMLSRPEFGGGMAEAETVGALRGNLPTRATVDSGIANQAALDYLRQTDPAKFIELTTPKAEAAPASVKEYQFAVSQGYKGSYTDYQLAQRAAGAAGGGLPPQAIANPVYEDPTYWGSGNVAYQTGGGETAYAEAFLRPEEYVSMGYAAPYTREQLLAAVNPENIRY